MKKQYTVTSIGNDVSRIFWYHDGNLIDSILAYNWEICADIRKLEKQGYEYAVDMRRLENELDALIRQVGDLMVRIEENRHLDLVRDDTPKFTIKNFGKTFRERLCEDSEVKKILEARNDIRT